MGEMDGASTTHGRSKDCPITMVSLLSKSPDCADSIKVSGYYHSVFFKMADESVLNLKVRVQDDTERGKRFWNTSVVEMKFSVERDWIKKVRKGENKPNYGMGAMDSLLEEVVGNKLELAGPVIDAHLEEIGRGILNV